MTIYGGTESMTEIFQFCHILGCFCHGFVISSLIDILYQKNVTKMSLKRYQVKNGKK